MNVNNKILEIELTDDDDSDSSSVVEIKYAKPPVLTDQSNYFNNCSTNLNQIRITKIESLSGKENCWVDDEQPAKQPEVSTQQSNSSSNHLLEYQKELTGDQRSNNVSVPEEKIVGLAEESDKQIELPYNLNYHKKEFMRKPSNYKTIYQCMKCDYNTHNMRSVKTHIEAHNCGNSHKCPDCLYISVKKQSMYSHFIRKHSIEKKPFQCQFCNYSTYHQTTSQQHIISHTEKPSYQCPYCPYVAKCDNSLAIHIRNHFL